MLYKTLANKSTATSYALAFLAYVISITITFLSPQEVVFEVFGSATLGYVCHFLVAILVAYYCQFIYEKLKVSKRGDFSIFIVLSFVLPLITYSKEGFYLLIGAGISMHVYARLMSLYNKTNCSIQEFEIGILAGLASVVNPVFLGLIPFILFSVSSAKTNQWRDYAVVILGYLFVYFLIVVYYFLADSSTQLIFELTPRFSIGNIPSMDRKEQLVIVGLLLFLLTALRYCMSSLDKMNIKDRLHYKNLIGLLICISLGFFVIKNSISLTEGFVVLSVLSMGIAQPYFQKKKRAMWNDIFLLLLLVSVVADRFI